MRKGFGVDSSGRFMTSELAFWYLVLWAMYLGILGGWAALWWLLPGIWPALAGVPTVWVLTQLVSATETGQDLPPDQAQPRKTSR